MLKILPCNERRVEFERSLWQWSAARTRRLRNLRKRRGALIASTDQVLIKQRRLHRRAERHKLEDTQPVDLELHFEVCRVALLRKYINYSRRIKGKMKNTQFMMS